MGHTRNERCLVGLKLQKSNGTIGKGAGSEGNGAGQKLKERDYDGRRKIGIGKNKQP